MIEVDGLVKRHGPLEVLRGVTLRVARGEVAAIIGPSGGGKSTFLRCLNGLELFQGGSVTVDGLRVGVETPSRERSAIHRQVRRRVGMVFQGFNLFPHHLSGGQQQRVAIARALAMEPQAILFDEPTSALDPRMTGEVLAVMADLARDGLTMVVVTHAMRFARQVAQTVHVFGAGQVLESGPPRQIFEDPRHEATRALLAETQAA